MYKKIVFFLMLAVMQSTLARRSEIQHKDKEVLGEVQQKDEKRNYRSASVDQYDLKTIAQMLYALHQRIDGIEERIQSIVNVIGSNSEDQTVTEALRKIKMSVEDLEEAAARRVDTSSMNVVQQVGSGLKDLLGGKFEDLVGTLLSSTQS